MSRQKIKEKGVDAPEVVVLPLSLVGSILLDNVVLTTTVLSLRLLFVVDLVCCFIVP